MGYACARAGGRLWGALPAAPASRAHFSTSPLSEVFSSLFLLLSFLERGLNRCSPCASSGCVKAINFAVRCSVSFPVPGEGAFLMCEVAVTVQHNVLLLAVGLVLGVNVLHVLGHLVHFPNALGVCFWWAGDSRCPLAWLQIAKVQLLLQRYSPSDRCKTVILHQPHHFVLLFHSIIESLVLEGTHKGCLVYLPCSEFGRAHSMVQQLASVQIICVYVISVCFVPLSFLGFNSRLAAFLGSSLNGAVCPPLAPTRECLFPGVFWQRQSSFLAM